MKKNDTLKQQARNRVDFAVIFAKIVPMSSLYIIQYISQFLVVFSIGSTLGWVLEFFYRNLTLKNDDIINPGFLGGPYLPIYGFGLYLVYLTGSLALNFWLAVLIFAVCATMLELVTGVFFFKVYNLRLWDYTGEHLNLHGYICLRFSLYWAAIGAFALRFLYTVTQSAVMWMNSNIHYTFFLGLFYGVVLSDIVNSFNIASTLSVGLRELKRKGLPYILDYGNFGLHLRDMQKKLKERSILTRFLLPFGNVSKMQMNLHLEDFFEKLRSRLKQAGE